MISFPLPHSFVMASDIGSNVSVVRVKNLCLVRRTCEIFPNAYRALPTALTLFQANAIGLCPLKCSCSLTSRRGRASTARPHVANDVRSRDPDDPKQVKVVCRNRQIRDLDWMNDDRFPPNVTHLWVSSCFDVPVYLLFFSRINTVYSISACFMWYFSWTAATASRPCVTCSCKDIKLRFTTI